MRRKLTSRLAALPRGSARSRGTPHAIGQSTHHRAAKVRHVERSTSANRSCQQALQGSPTACPHSHELSPSNTSVCRAPASHAPRRPSAVQLPVAEAKWLDFGLKGQVLHAQQPSGLMRSHRLEPEPSLGASPEHPDSN